MSRAGRGEAATSVDLAAAYRSMLLIRAFESRALELRLADQIHGVIHPYVGQEAIAVGVAAALAPRDRVVSNHRGHGHLLARGADPRRMMAELYGRSDGYCRGMGGSMHIADFELGIIGANGIVGAGLPLAVGSALTSTLREDAQVITACFFGDGATGEGAFHESMNISAIHRLPVLWVCENNRYAAETPLDLTLPTGTATSYAAGYGMWCETGDGTDVVAVAELAGRAVEHIATTRQPAFIELTAYRYGVHAQRRAPVPERRPDHEREQWLERDPLMIAARRLRAEQLADDAQLDEWRAAAERAIDDSIRFAEASPFPAADVDTIGVREW